MAHIEEKLNTEQKYYKFHIEHIEKLTLEKRCLSCELRKQFSNRFYK